MCHASSGTIGFGVLGSERLLPSNIMNKCGVLSMYLWIEYDFFDDAGKLREIVKKITTYIILPTARDLASVEYLL